MEYVLTVAASDRESLLEAIKSLESIIMSEQELTGYLEMDEFSINMEVKND